MEGVERVLNFVDNVLWLGLPDILRGLLICLLVVGLFHKQIKRHPWAFYIYPFYLLVIYTFYGVSSLMGAAWIKAIKDTWMEKLLWLPHRYGLDTVIGVGFIMIVMFIGVLPKTKFVKNLYQIRKEMSIMGGAILIGHGLMRIPTAVYAWTNQINPFLFIAYGILGGILLALIIAPWITSFDSIRRKMNPKTWKKLQTYTSVPLFVLMLLFGFAFNFGIATHIFSDFSGQVYMTKMVQNNPVDSLGFGYQVARASIAYKIYLLMIVSYIGLRYRKPKKKTYPAAVTYTR